MPERVDWLLLGRTEFGTEQSQEWEGMTGIEPA